MKKFEAPTMGIVKLNHEDIMRTSTECMVDALSCLKCYCAAVDCDPVYICDGFECSPAYEE